MTWIRSVIRHLYGRVCTCVYEYVLYVFPSKLCLQTTVNVRNMNGMCVCVWFYIAHTPICESAGSRTVKMKRRSQARQDMSVDYTQEGRRIVSLG